MLTCYIRLLTCYIRSVPIFEKASSIFVQQIAVRLESHVYPPQENVIVQGEVGKEMYFIAQVPRTS